MTGVFILSHIEKYASISFFTGNCFPVKNAPRRGDAQWGVKGRGRKRPPQARECAKAHSLFKDTAHMHGKVALCIIYPKCYRQILMSFISLEWYCKNVRKHTK